MDNGDSHSIGHESLHIRLLGDFQVVAGRGVVGEAEWRLRKARSLVKLLAIASGHRLHREQVMEALWPDEDAQSAARNFRKALHHARRALEPSGDHSPGSASPFLLTQGEMLVLQAPGTLSIDVDAFETVARTANARHAIDPADPVDHLAAIQLYTGDLLPEERYEEWTIARREELRNTYLRLLAELAQIYETRSEWPPAIETLRRIVTADPLNEDAHADLIRVYALAGQRHQAVQQYRQLKDVLRREVDSEPQDATRRLYEEIVAGRFLSQQSAIRSDYASAPMGYPAEARRHNLPAQLTSFVGRQTELAEVKRLLASGRLLTLTGPGGCGKTRLAIEVASQVLDDYPDGVWLAELAALSDPVLVPNVVASALGVREQADKLLDQTLADYLGSKRLLLVLDNCEHLIGACAHLVETLLRHSSNTHILATSRETLNVPGETAWSIPGLSTPNPEQMRSADETAPARYEAVQLFAERAATVSPGFGLSARNAPAVARICYRLDGIALAIELAAARVKVLSVEQIAERLGDSISLLTAGGRTALPRQQTLRATVDWSYDLLSDQERALFRRLSVFAGGFTLEAVEEVCARGIVRKQDVLDLLSRLVDKSLVTAKQLGEELGMESELGGVRYRTLETLRQYGRERLEESGETEAIQQSHTDYYLALCEQAEQELIGPKQIDWLDLLDREFDNVRAALDC